MKTAEHEAPVTIDSVIQALQKVIDPELNLDLWYLGLIYDIVIENDYVKIIMTLTTPACPAGPEILRDVKTKVRAVSGVKQVKVDLTFDPPWQAPDELADLMGYW